VLLDGFSLVVQKEGLQMGCHCFESNLDNPPSHGPSLRVSAKVSLVAAGQLFRSLQTYHPCHLSHS